jgi:hypothetical protein
MLKKMGLRRWGAQSGDFTICYMTHRTNTFQFRETKGALNGHACHISNGEET